MVRRIKSLFANVQALETVLVTVLVVLLLSGCIGVTKRDDLPVAIPENFSEGGRVPYDRKWWLEFDDPQLQTLVEQALGGNLSLLAASNRIAEARAIAAKAGGDLLPQAEAAGSVDSVRDHRRGSSADSFVLGIGASYEIDLWGRLDATRNSLVLESEASESDYYNAVADLSAQVATVWFRLSEALLQKDLLHRQQQTNSKLLELITTQYRFGRAQAADVLQQTQLVEGANADLASVRLDIKLLNHQLAALVGTIPESELPAPALLPELTALPVTPLPADLLLKRPDVQSRRKKLQAADYRVAAAVADRLPRLSISADISTGGSRSSDLFSDWFTSLGANLLGPLIDGEKRAAEVTRTRAVARQRYYELGQTILNALVEVEDSLIREKELRNVIASQQIQLRLAKQTITQVTTRYRQGAEEYQRVLLALISSQNLERQILTSHRQLLANRVELYRALSGRIDGTWTAPHRQPDRQSGAIPESSPQLPTLLQQKGCEYADTATE
ncbi:efflux transporter outer membrane subunit [Desulforhopalus singaporensis]|uniref:Efflux transporter, outer membrane factor (OMF) lipoprotein, NodT family n=1 Tax=Desulforhopalus singaporensis TaxID=91360 RepID=A0A1H0JXP7_9BACT|nr:efflux transporter outer membrane subunit [Desulforhopalus singaporensis]SDO48568.1 efflux transporter, outer membrane factor (OMF) lipoprotein, NodT family [Desulforhopalus singaporensis]